MKKELEIYRDEVVISTNKPTLLKFSNKKRGFKRILQKLGFIKKYHYVEFYPLTLGQRLRYSEQINEVAISIIKDKVSITDVDAKALINSIAILLQRGSGSPLSSIYKIVESLDDNEFEGLIKFIYDSLQADSFLKSIILMLEMSLKTEEIIADVKDSTLGNSKGT